MGFQSRGLVIATTCLFGLIAPSAVAESFYEGKRLTVLTSSAPGGGNDVRARLVARHIGKHIPGNPTVIVQNMPGGAHLVMNNHFNNIAEPDGLTVGQTVRGIYWAQLLGIKEARFDLKKVHWIGSTSDDGATLIVRSNLGYKSLIDMRKSGRELVVACSTLASANYVLGQLLDKAMNVPVKMVCGYQGTNDVKIALARDEVDAIAGRSISALLSIDKDEVDSGRWTVLMQYGEKRSAAFPNVPTAVEQESKDPSRAKVIIAAATADLAIGWPFYVPAGVPKERVKILRDAFMKTMRDPDLLQEAKKSGIPIEPIAGDELDRIVANALSVPPELIPDLKILYYGPTGAPQ